MYKWPEFSIFFVYIGSFENCRFSSSFIKAIRAGSSPSSLIRHFTFMTGRDDNWRPFSSGFLIHPRTVVMVRERARAHHNKTAWNNFIYSYQTVMCVRAFFLSLHGVYVILHAVKIILRSLSLLVYFYLCFFIPPMTITRISNCRNEFTIYESWFINFL